MGFIAGLLGWNAIDLIAAYRVYKIIFLSSSLNTFRSLYPVSGSKLKARFFKILGFVFEKAQLFLETAGHCCL